MWKSRKIMLCQGHNIKNSLTLHLRFFQDLLWCSVPNSAEECSGRFVWYYHRFCTSSIHSLLTIAVIPSICDVVSGTDASDLEHMYLCSFGIAEFHILLWRGQEWNIDIYFDEWLTICGLGWFSNFLCVMEVERMRLIAWELAASLWADRLAWVGQRTPITNKVLLWHLPGTMRCPRISENLSHTVLNDPLPWMRAVTLWWQEKNE